MKRTVTSLGLCLLIGLVLLGCEKRGTLAPQKEAAPTCCGKAMMKDGSLAEMKCPDCGKISITGGSIDTPG